MGGFLAVVDALLKNMHMIYGLLVAHVGHRTHCYSWKGIDQQKSSPQGDED